MIRYYALLVDSDIIWRRRARYFKLLDRVFIDDDIAEQNIDQKVQSEERSLTAARAKKTLHAIEGARVVSRPSNCHAYEKKETIPKARIEKLAHTDAQVQAVEQQAEKDMKREENNIFGIPPI